MRLQPNQNTTSPSQFRTQIPKGFVLFLNPIQPPPHRTKAITMSSTQSISIKSAARKLPIKRKSPDVSTPKANPNFTPKIESELYEDDEESSLDGHKPPPFKFHRIWTESDEIRFLQGLLDSSSEGLIFPRDLHLFYHRFSNSMSQPYTKSQLSEKLRRLRRKFRVISTRISHGLDASLLSEHDQSLFAVSKKLWDPDCNSESPFNVNNKAKKKSTTVSVKVSFNPNFTPSMASSLVPIPTHDHEDGEDCEDEDCEVEIMDKEEHVDGVHGEEHIDGDSDGQEEELNLPPNDVCSGDGIRGIVAKMVMDVFDKSLKEVRMALVGNGLLCGDHKSSSISNGSSYQGKVDDLMKRCREQRIAELDVLARRVRLVLENSVHDQ